MIGKISYIIILCGHCTLVALMGRSTVPSSLGLHNLDFFMLGFEILTRHWNEFDYQCHDFLVHNVTCILVNNINITD